MSEGIFVIASSKAFPRSPGKASSSLSPRDNGSGRHSEGTLLSSFKGAIPFAFPILSSKSFITEVHLPHVTLSLETIPIREIVQTVPKYTPSALSDMVASCIHEVND